MKEDRITPNRLGPNARYLDQKQKNMDYQSMFLDKVYVKLREGFSVILSRRFLKRFEHKRVSDPIAVFIRIEKTKIFVTPKQNCKFPPQTLDMSRDRRSQQKYEEIEP